MKIVYGEKQVADCGIPINGYPISPSARKPQMMAQFLKQQVPGRFEFVEPVALTVQDFFRAHDPNFVQDILDQKIINGFGTYSNSVNASLPYTNGAMYLAAKLATKDVPSVALVSGFHHAGYDTHRNGFFCTFNGLAISALKLTEEDKMKKVAIVDADMHHGNGTDHILERIDKRLSDKIYHYSFGLHFTLRKQAADYLRAFDQLEKDLIEQKPEVIIYQSGADCHVDDPYGGLLTTNEMFQRDFKMFTIAKRLGIPLAWDLAGGYQVAQNGSIDKVLRLHYNTFRACKLVYGV